jgi:hypothetical protein
MLNISLIVRINTCEPKYHSFWLIIKEPLKKLAGLLTGAPTH